MRKVKKRLMYGAMALAIAGGAVGASAVLMPQAQAATDSQNVQHQHMGKGNKDMDSIASLLGIDQQELLAQLKAGKSIAEIAEAQGKTEQEVIDAIVQIRQQSIDQFVQSGKLTQEKADQIKAELPDQVKQFVEMQGMAKRHLMIMDNNLNNIAQEIGITQQELIDQLKAGKSIAEVAEAQGKTEAQLIDALLQREKDRLTKLVEKTGWFNPDQAKSGETDN
jgi:predicted DNA-binding protein YlxM (UPF0122 family)